MAYQLKKTNLEIDDSLSALALNINASLTGLYVWFQLVLITSEQVALLTTLLLWQVKISKPVIKSELKSFIDLKYFYVWTICYSVYFLSA